MSISQEQNEKDERSFCTNCRKITSWRKARKRSRCLSCNTIFPCAHVCEHWDCREERGEAKPDSNGVLRLVPPAILIFALSSLFSFSCGGDPDNNLSDPKDAQVSSPSPDAASPFPTPRPTGPPSPQTPGADAGTMIVMQDAGDAGAADMWVTGGGIAPNADGGSTGADVGTMIVMQDAGGAGAADMRVMDGGIAPNADGGSAGADARDTGVPPILQPKLDAGGRCQPGSQCPMAVDEGSGIYSLKSGTTNPPTSCIPGTGSFSAIGVYWFQDYQGKRYVFRIIGTCPTGATQPYVRFPYVKLEDVNPECGILTDQIQLGGEWNSFVGPHTFVVDRDTSCANNRGRCARYQCYDSSGKVIK
jgi:hypothetical protein